MKKIILILFLVSLFVSCSKNQDERLQYQFETIVVKSVVFPTKFAKDSITEIPMKYILPTNCYGFNGFYYLKEANNRTVAIETIKYLQNNCTANTTERQDILKFKPILTGTYHFKFWKNTTPAGLDEFFEYDAVVSH